MTKVQQVLLAQRRILLDHFIKVNSWCGESKNTEGAEIARKALEDFDKTYSDLIKDAKDISKR